MAHKLIDSPNCFERVGMKVPIKRGGKCPCGARVRFDIVKARTEHFMVCPVVAKKTAKALASLDLSGVAVTDEGLSVALERVSAALGVDVDAVALARRVSGDRFG